MEWLLAGLAGIGFVEMLVRLPIRPTLTRSRQTATWVATVIRSRRISDHWKEKALPSYALRLFKLTMLTAFYLALSFAPLALLFFVADLINVPLIAFSLSLTGIGYMTVLSIIYAKVRFRRVPASL